MPRFAKIMIAITILGLFGYLGYVYIIEPYLGQYREVEKLQQVDRTPPAEKVLFHKGEVVVAKCKDFKTIGLYLESDISLNEYNTTLLAVANFPSTLLCLPNQELTFKTLEKKSNRLMVYKCQTSKGVLMGKLKKI